MIDENEFEICSDGGYFETLNTKNYKSITIYMRVMSIQTIYTFLGGTVYITTAFSTLFKFLRRYIFNT
jgi:hypothetical protein